MSDMRIPALDLNDPLDLLNLSRDGITYNLFQEIVDSSSFSIKQWSIFLHLTERTIQRYKKEKKKFETVQSEKILEIAKLQAKGIEVFEEETYFDAWLNSNIIALGNIKPITLLDNSFGIDMLMDELGRIEHGVLA